VGARTGRTLLIHGEDDAEVPVAHSTRLGEEARVEVISGLGHFEMLDPARSHWPLVTAALDEVTI
jgi:pimeloyl-ACP methyl ester carboxylesterase